MVWTPTTLSAEEYGIAALVRRSGAERPVVFLHGIAGSVRFWPALLPVNAFDSRPCASVSLPGHAPSQVPSGFDATVVTPGMFADITAAVIRQIFGQQSVHLVGWSTGGFAALAVAARHPELTTSVTSICGFARGQWRESLGMMQRLASAGRTGQMLFRMGIGAMAQHRWIYNLVVRRFASKKREAREAGTVHDAMFEDLTQHDHQVLAKLFQGLRTADLSPDLKQIQSPVLIVGGRRDPVIPYTETQHLVSEIPTAELLTLEGCGHLFFSEARRYTFEAVDEWVTRHD